MNDERGVISVSLEEVVKSGTWGPLTLGSTAHDLLTQAGAPDFSGCPDARGIEAVWKYGDIEVLFADDRVYCINVHFVTDRPRGGGGIRLDPWILRTGLPLEAFEQVLASMGLAWHKEVPAYDPTQVHVVFRDSPKLYASFVTVEEKYSPPKGWWGLFFSTP